MTTKKAPDAAADRGRYWSRPKPSALVASSAANRQHYQLSMVWTINSNPASRFLTFGTLDRYSDRD